MLPLVDMHVHLLAGLDDGPRNLDVALEMCRLAAADGTKLAAALAHQNEQWPDVTPDRIRQGVQELSTALTAAGIEMEVIPCAEVMVTPDLVASWQSNALLSVGDRRSFVLLEMPHNMCVDIRHTVRELRRCGVRAILAHPERTPELLHTPGKIESFIEQGCLVQVSATSITRPKDRETEQALRDWVRRGVVHLLGSDGHSIKRRPPLMSGAVNRIRRWAGDAAADRIGSTIGQMVLRGLPVRTPAPHPPSRKWWARLWCNA